MQSVRDAIYCSRGGVPYNRFWSVVFDNVEFPVTADVYGVWLVLREGL